MPFNLQSTSNFFIRFFGDTVAPGNGSSALTPLRFDQYNGDIGRSKTDAGDDGDLRLIDSAVEVISLDPAANLDGSATNKHSIAFLVRWLIRLIQSYATRYEDPTTPLSVRLSSGTAALNTNTGASSGATLRAVLANESIQCFSIAGQGSQTALNQNILLVTAGTGPIDCAQYQSISFQVVPAAGTVTAGAITFEGSDDPAFSSSQIVYLYDANSFTSNPISTYTLTAAVTRSFVGGVFFRYFRARISTAITGTTTGVRAFATLRMPPFIPQVQIAANPTAANLLVTPVQATASSLQAVTRSNAFTGTATITRAANTTQYAAGDVYGAAFTIANIGNTTGYITLVLIRLLFNIPAMPSGMGNLRLYLYNATPPSAIADNSPWTLNSGDRASYLAEIVLGTPTLLGNGTVVLQTVCNLTLKIASGTSLFGYLVTDGAPIPVANSETVSAMFMAVEP